MHPSLTTFQKLNLEKVFKKSFFITIVGIWQHQSEGEVCNFKR